MYACLLLLFAMALALVVIGIVLRFGYAADELAWALAAIVLAFSAVFYPVTALPGWAQTAATFIPLRTSSRPCADFWGRDPAWGNLWTAGMLDEVYIGAAFAFARRMFGTFQRRGLVTRYM